MTLEERQQAMRERWSKRRVHSPEFWEKRKAIGALFTWSPETHARFMIKVDDETNGDCWLWLAQLDRDGYGRFSLKGVKWSAHRAAYEAVHGTIPEGLTLDHLCRNRSCVNPMHLEAVPHKVNVNRGLRKLRPEEIVQQIVQRLPQVHANNVNSWCERGDLNPLSTHVNHNESTL